MTATALFTAAVPAGALRARELEPGDVPALQRFFDDNPAYFMAVHGEPAHAAEAQQEFDDAPPAGMGYRRRWLLAFEGADGRLVGMASLVEDFLADAVWHIGLFVVATALHGQGAAPALYAAMEAWMRGRGARWIRLGAVRDHARAERFWWRQGYVEVRQRVGVAMGRRVNDLRVMVKPLGETGVDAYLERVARDNPGAP
ncbi:GNAT family N-acetyltransferase [uncultured Methylibium sp.]|uniref:GNAT family N-acetyltransferase n=1 Tax=uncultured Methylibium sp. TaxID=381093 RepID=UPI0025E7B07B|nr:GNAT family N-acetyltransferase [uncultured Methylibium sp.]